MQSLCQVRYVLEFLSKGVGANHTKLVPWNKATVAGTCQL